MYNTISIQQEVEDFLRQKLVERHAELTPEQLVFFGKVFPNGVERKDLESAIDLCDRTIRKNKEGRESKAGHL